jgi:hypothetical protein
VASRRHCPCSRTSRCAVPSSSSTCKRALRLATAGSHQRSSAGHGPDQPMTPTGELPAICSTKEEGAEVHRPRPVTTTGAPSEPRSSTGTGTGWTRAGEGAGRRPGQGGTTWAPTVTPEGRRPGRTLPDARFAPPPRRAALVLVARTSRFSSDSSPQGTRRICSSGPLPPVRTGVRTASWPRRPWIRARPRSTCRLAPATPPSKSIWRPSSATAPVTVSRNMVTPAVGALTTGPWSHPSSCHRTLSTMERALKGRSPLHQRCSDSPCSVSASTSS